MEATQSRTDAARLKECRSLRQHIGLSRTVLLLLLAVSVVNQLMLLLKINYHFLFSMSVPYYLNWLAHKLGEDKGVTFFKVFALLATVVIFVVYVMCWLSSAQRREYLKTALVLYCLDTVLLTVFAFSLLNNPFSCLLEILVHLVGVALIYDGHRSARRLARLSRKRKTARSAPRRRAG